MKIIKTTNDFEVLVDDEDYEKVALWHWYAVHGEGGDGGIRVISYELGKIPIANFILDAEKEQTIDHRDRDPYNNQRANLRFCTRNQNMQNRGLPKNNKSGFKGVTVNPGRGKRWKASIGFNKQIFHLGYFDTPEEAAAAYDQAAREMHGEFAVTNESLGSKSNGHIKDNRPKSVNQRVQELLQ